MVNNYDFEAKQRKRETGKGKVCKASGKIPKSQRKTISELIKKVLEREVHRHPTAS